MVGRGPVVSVVNCVRNVLEMSSRFAHQVRRVARIIYFRVVAVPIYA